VTDADAALTVPEPSVEPILDADEEKTKKTRPRSILRPRSSSSSSSTEARTRLESSRRPGSFVPFFNRRAEEAEAEAECLESSHDSSSRPRLKRNFHPRGSARHTRASLCATTTTTTTTTTMATRRLLRPLMDRVLVEKITPPTKSVGGVLLPETMTGKRVRRPTRLDSAGGREGGFDFDFDFDFDFVRSARARIDDDDDDGKTNGGLTRR